MLAGTKLLGTTCNLLVSCAKHKRSGSNKKCGPGKLVETCRVQNMFGPLVSKSIGLRVVQRLAGSTYWLKDICAPQLQSTGARACQCVRTNTAVCANAGNNATKVGNNAGSCTLQPSWLHAITGCRLFYHWGQC